MKRLTPNRPRKDKQDRVEAIFADFDLLPIKDARFVVRAIRIALAVKERNQALAEAPTSQLTIPISAELKSAPGESSATHDAGGSVEMNQARIVLPGAVQREKKYCRTCEVEADSGGCNSAFCPVRD